MRYILLKWLQRQTFPFSCKKWAVCWVLPAVNAFEIRPRSCSSLAVERGHLGSGPVQDSFMSHPCFRFPHWLDWNEVRPGLPSVVRAALFHFLPICSCELFALSISLALLTHCQRPLPREPPRHMLNSNTERACGCFSSTCSFPGFSIR